MTVLLRIANPMVAFKGLNTLYKIELVADYMRLDTSVFPYTKSLPLSYIFGKKLTTCCELNANSIMF